MKVWFKSLFALSLMSLGYSTVGYAAGEPGLTLRRLRGIPAAQFKGAVAVRAGF